MTNNNGLEFEVGTPDGSQNQSAGPSRKDDPELKDISRQSFRFPVQKIGAVKVLIADHTLDLVNIVVNDKAGIGIRLPQDDTFALNEELPVIRFKLFDKDFELAGKVQHISPDVTGHYICGIMLVRLTADDKQGLRAILQKLHSELFR